MKRKHRILIILAVTLLMVCMCSVPAFAVTESEVQAQVDTQGKEAVTGNIFIWFLCAIAFLKISQKIDYVESRYPCGTHRRLHAG